MMSGQIIAPFELERLLRRSIADNPRRSALPVLLFIALTMEAPATHVTLNKLYERVTERPLDCSAPGLLKSFVDVKLWRHYKADIKLETVRGLATRTMNCLADTSDFMRVPRDSNEGREALTLYTISKQFLTVHPDASPVFMLILIAVYLRKYHRHSDIHDFLQPLPTIRPLVVRTVRNLAELGLVHLEKTAFGTGGAVIVRRISNV